MKNRTNDVTHQQMISNINALIRTFAELCTVITAYFQEMQWQAEEEAWKITEEQVQKGEILYEQAALETEDISL